MAHGERYTVLIAHRDPLVEEGLVALFGAQEEFHVLRRPIDRAGTTTAEIASIGRGVDAAVADYHNGIALSRTSLPQRGPGAVTRVVIVTASDCESEIRSAIERGVAGYFLAGTPLAEIVAGVRAVLQGARRFSAGVSERLAESLSSERLTSREEDVLELVVSGSCNKAIAKELRIAVGTVKSHLKSIFEKLQVATRTQAVAAAGRRGLLGERRVPASSRVPVARPRSFDDGARIRQQLSELSA